MEQKSNQRTRQTRRPRQLLPMQTTFSRTCNSLQRQTRRPNQKTQLTGGENTTENNKESPIEKIVKRLKTNNIHIKGIPDENWRAREAIKEINEALIDFFESV